MRVDAHLAAGELAPRPSIPVPRVIRRNALLLSGAEAFVGMGQQMVPTLGAVMVMQLTGSAALGGIGGSMLGLTRALVSYPSGRLADRYGRKGVLIIGLLVSLVGAIGLGVAMLRLSTPAFLVSLLMFGLGTGASQQQRRLSAADLYPADRRAQGLGLILTGSLVGAIGGPGLIALAGALTGGDGRLQLAASWFLVPFVLLPSLGLILAIQPDPREIAMDLGRYWPGHQAEVEPAHTAAKVTLMTFARNYPQVVALAAMSVLFGNMTMMMSLAPLTMSADGMALTAISMTVSLHVVGMWGFSLPIGKLADRFGRRRVVLAGVLLSTAGTLLVALTHTLPPMVVGLFIIGLGWACGNVATAAIVADTTPPRFRGAAMGANSSFSAVASVAAPLLGGLLVQLWGAQSLAVITLLFLTPTLALVFRLREPRPGSYAHATTF